jgi:hypothetical protein
VRIAKVVLAGMLVIVIVVVVLIFLGSNMEARLGGPCSFPDQGPLPSICPGR